MATADATNILQTQITTLQNVVTQLSADLHGLQSGCNARHRLNLTAEIARIDTELTNLLKLLNEFNDNVKINTKEIESINYKLSELTGRVNILTLKTDDMTESDKRSKETRTNFILEIIVIVLASIITGVIGFTATHAWSALQQAQRYFNTSENSKR